MHSYPHFTMLRIGTRFFNRLENFGSAVLSDYDARVSHRLMRASKSPLNSCREIAAPNLVNAVRKLLGPSPTDQLTESFCRMFNARSMT